MSLVTTANHSPELEDDRELEEGNLSEDLEWGEKRQIFFLSFLESFPFKPTALFLSHRPAELKKKTLLQKEKNNHSSLSLTTGTIYWACIRIETNPKELFVADLWVYQTWQTWDACHKGNKRRNSLRPAIFEVAWPHYSKRMMNSWIGGRKHETNKQIMFCWKLAASYTAKKEDILCLWIIQPTVVVIV